MNDPNSVTFRYLQQWKDGNPEGLDRLVEKHLPWIYNHVRKRLGHALRKKAESGDIVQDAMVQFLKYGPRIRIANEGHFRGILVRIVENSLRDQHDWFKAKRRAMSQERPLPSDSVLDLDPPEMDVKSPSQDACRNEREAWVRLGVELLDPEMRKIIVLRDWEKLTFPEIGRRLGVSEKAAGMRYHRAIKALTRKVGDLRRGKLPKLDEYAPDPGEEDTPSFKEPPRTIEEETR